MLILLYSLIPSDLCFSGLAIFWQCHLQQQMARPCYLSSMSIWKQQSLSRNIVSKDRFMWMYMCTYKLIKLYWFYRGRLDSYTCKTQSNVYILKANGMLSVTSSLSRSYVKIIYTRDLTILGNITFPKHYWECRRGFHQLSVLPSLRAAGPSKGCCMCEERGYLMQKPNGFKR